AVRPSILVIQTHSVIIMTHSALHHSSFLALLIPIMPPYQSLTNHAYYAAYQFMTHPLYSTPYSASPLCLLSPITPLTNHLQMADQFLNKHLVISAYKATDPHLYNQAAKGAKQQS